MSASTTVRRLPTQRLARSAQIRLQAARQGLADAAEAISPHVRYVCAHMSALRAAAAVLITREPVSTHHRGRPRSVWVLLPEVAPALSEWAAFFAAGAGTRAAAEAGLPRAVTMREADELLRDAETFVRLVEETLGAPGQLALPVADSRAS